MTFEQQWIEFDYNPFILFSENGKILSLNSEAQYLMGSTDTSTIFEIATAYASTSFGFNTTFIDLEFGRFKFFGVTVGYENENEIGIRLYQSPSFKFNKPKNGGEKINIYTLIDLCISSNSIGNSALFTKELDPTMPEVYLHTNAFIKMLNKIYASMAGNTEIRTRLYFRVGEYIKFEGKKYTIFSVEVSSESMDKKLLSNINMYADENNLFVTNKENMIVVNIPMI